MKAFLLLGSNVGNRIENLSLARTLIHENIAPLFVTSSLYETAPWGNEDQAPFINQVIVVETKLHPPTLLKRLKGIEQKMGRKQAGKWEPRIIDIDILLIDDQHFRSELLTVPHPRMHERRFTLVPIAEIDSQAHHPVLKMSVGELLNICDDKLDVRRLQLTSNS